ncbi:hypothetical protein [Streptomyces fulvoviolaceus]|uniref:hypothetical protein n=1 Tax=Streptomyces fulvoviolaceus TaxID=285535 RepID=UPI0004C60F41|nr:hypothetical protein [Streptomyces fulvoviolaceus]
MISILFVVALIALTMWAKHAVSVRKIRKAERARVRALNPNRYGRRLSVWALHKVFARRFLWQEPTAPVTMRTPVRIARRGLWLTVKIRIDRHAVVAGLTGSGKSSTMRVMSAHALKSGAGLEIWDLKPGGPEAAVYAGKARCITSPDGLVSRIRELLADPARDGSELVIIVDETSSVVRNLTTKQFEELCSLVDMARIFKIRLWFGIQHPSRVNLPSEIQANIDLTLAHRVHSRIESDVVFPSLPDWMPHELIGAGALLIHAAKRKPHKLSAFWLSPERFVALPDAPLGYPEPDSGPVTAPVPAITLSKLPEAAPVPKPVPLSDNQQLVCLALEIAERPMEAKEVIDATGLPQNRVSDALKALVGKGVLVKDADDYPALFTLAPKDGQS